VDREAADQLHRAFAKACGYLNYDPWAKGLAHVAGAGTGLVSVALLVVLWLFADLMVSRGRLPNYHDVPPVDQERFLREWAALPVPEVPADPRPGAETRPGVPAFPVLAAGAAGLAGTFPAGGPAPLLAASALGPGRVSPNERVARLEWAGYDPMRALQLAALEPSPELPRRELGALWRGQLAWILRESVHLPAPTIRDLLQRRNFDEINHGVLSLVVRSRLHGDWLAPAVAWVARWNPWMWNTRTDNASVVFPSFLLGLFLIGVVLTLLGAFLHLLMCALAARAAIEATTRLRRAVYHHTFRLGTLAFRALGPSEAVSVLARHIEAVHDALYTRLTVSFQAPILFGLLLAFALVVQFWLALSFLLFAALVWLVGGQVAASFRRRARVAANQASELLTALRESLMLMRLVKCYLMDQFNQARVERQLARYARVQGERHRGEALPSPALVFLGTLCALVLLFVAGVIVLYGQMGVAGEVALATALVSLYRPLGRWLESRRLLRRGREAAAQVFGFLERRGQVGQVVGAEFLPPLAQRIEFDGVSLREPGGNRMLLEEVTLTIPAGQRIGLVGADDLEKHALVYLIPRLLDPTAGEIRIDQHNLRWVTLDSLRAQTAIVLMHNLVFHDTVANNIGCGDTAYTLPRIIEAAKVAHAHHFIQKLPQGYETPIGELGHSLTVSEQFRIALARAILRDPALLIIEEPEAALDEDTKSLVDDTLTRILPGRTAIFLPHRISTIRSCDRLHLLQRGRIVASGIHKELLAQNPLYRHLHYLEFNVMDEQV
jgi:ATP-binding cassette subfamily B protein